MAIAVCLPTLIAFFARWSWTADLLSNFRVQMFWLSLAAGVLLLALRRRKSAALVLLSTGWIAFLIAPSYWPSANGESSSVGPTRRVLYANVLVNNRDHGKLLRLIEAENPDLIVLVEVTPAWVAALAPLRERYPHRLEAPRDGAFGMAIYSQLPMPLEEIALGARDGNLAIRGAYRDGETTVNVLGTHPPPPVSVERAASRNSQILEAAKLVRQREGEALLIGDLNNTPWSPFFRDALAATDLRDSRNGFGVQATWPADRRLLRIPIDHCLASPGIVIQRRRVGPPIGSDHLPLIIDYAIVRP